MNFPAKIFLFGEYGILLGGSGLAIPYPRFSGKLVIDSSSLNQSSFSYLSNQSINHLSTYFRNNEKQFKFLNLKRLYEDTIRGLWFDSTISSGYGIGSSGALIAAIYSEYRRETIADYRVVRQHLSSMEDYFHGSSSGIDPFVALIQKPVLLKPYDSLELLSDWSLERLGLNVFLVDTGIKAKTISLVDWFKAKMMQNEFRIPTNEDYLKTNRIIVEKIRQNEFVPIKDIMTISRYQLDYLSPMIPESFQKHFLNGLASDYFAFKLCGSGGGGYMLCFSADTDYSIEYLKKGKMNFVRITN
jgi:mevalonate kinase